MESTNSAECSQPSLPLDLKPAQPWRILLWAEDPAAKPQIEAALRPSGVVCEVVSVATGEAFRHALREPRAWHAILADVSAPGADTAGVLTDVQAAAARTPVVLLTGSMDVEQAAACVRCGAADLLLKEHLSQIGQVLKRVVHDVPESTTRRVAPPTWSPEQARLLDFADTAAYVQDLSGHILYWNRAAEKLYGWRAEEVVGQPMAERLKGEPSALDQARGHTLEHGEWRGELRLRGQGPEPRVVQSRWVLLRDAQGAPQSILVMDADITEQRRIEAHLLRAQRLEGLGVLAGGISHDLNNILAPILMSVGVLRHTAAGDESRQLVDVIESSAKRCADLVRHLLAFSRGSGAERLLFRPEHVLREVVQIVQETFPRFIRLERRTDGGLWPLSGNPTQLEQVLLNLCLNARDAMPHGGDLILEVRNVRIDEAQARELSQARPGAYVLFRVLDTGSGIPAELLDRIFEPFFTTKPPGQGTGLGLATVLSIVRGHGGFIDVQSTPGRGTCLEVYLPAEPQAENEPTLSGAPTPHVPRGRGEWVLAVDDEPSILEVTRETLAHHGYRVLTAQDGLRGLTLFLQYQSEVKVVLADIAMPHMDGIAMVRAMRRIDPRLEIIVSTGLGLDTAFGDWRQTLRELQVRHVLAKPYKSHELLDLVAQVLQRR